jgi:hypothetical protein
MNYLIYFHRVKRIFNIVSYITESKKNSLIDNIFIIIFFIFPILFLSPLAVNLGLILISLYFFYYVLKKKFFIWTSSEIVKILFIFWVYLFINSFLNYNSFLEVQKSFSYIRYIIFFISVVFLLPQLNVKFKNLFFVYLIIILLFCIDIFIQFIFDKNLIGFECQMSCQRNSSFFKDELIAGSFILYIGIISLSYFYFRKEKKLLIPLLILFLISILLTGDRTPFFMMIILLFSVAVLKKELRTKFFVVLIFISMFFGVTSLFSDKIYKRYISNTLNIFTTSELSMVSLKWWLERTEKQEVFLKKISSKDYILTNQDKIEYNDLDIIQIIGSNKETLFLEDKNFYEIMQKRSNIVLITEMVMKEIGPLKIKKNYIENIMLERKKNNTQSKWYNNFLDNQYGAHYLTAYSIFLDNPIIGTGIKSFRVKCKDYDKINSISANSRCTTHPHNLHLEILSEFGLIGYLLFILIILSFLKTFYLNIKNFEIIYVFAFSLVICIIFPFRPSGSFFSTISSMFFWLSFSIFFLINELQNNK